MVDGGDNSIFNPHRLWYFWETSWRLRHGSGADNGPDPLLGIGHRVNRRETILKEVVMEDSASVEIEIEVIKKTEEAVLIGYGSIEAWIPMSRNHRGP